MNKLPKNFCEPHAAARIEPKAPVLVALSGGADSTSLLHMMCVCRESLGFKLYAAHINHNIRTADYNNEANRDERFCRELCERLGVELFVLNADIPALCAECGESTETIARRVRYEFFESVMREHNIPILLTAHNSNDNLETQIFNLCRGCGIEGISGIPRTRQISDAGIVLRPLLNVSREEILLYCNTAGLDFVTDSTNTEIEYTRNRIRNKIIPELMDMFDSPDLASSRLSSAATEDADFILSEAKRVYHSFADKKIPLDRFNSLHVSVCRRIIRIAFGEISSQTLEAVHQNAVIELAKKKIPHSRISLPDGCEAAVEDGALIFMRTPAPNESTSYDIPLSLGANIIDGTDFSVLVSTEADSLPTSLTLDGKSYALYSSAIIRVIDAANLRARSRREGDTVKTNKMTKKVKKLMCDKKVPLCDRSSLPLIEEGGELIYVPLCAVCDRATAKNNPQKLTLCIFKHERKPL